MMETEGEKMNTIQTKYIVVSLPRTGTMSMCQMMKTLGFGVQHAPGPSYKSFLYNRKDVEVLADTPMFRPSVIKEILEASDDVKFIYITKPSEEWVKSMEKTGLSKDYNNMLRQYREDKTQLSSHNLIDLESLHEIMWEDYEFDPETAHKSFLHHMIDIEKLIPSDRLLVYNFLEGWVPLCEFVGATIPSVEVPHLNKDTMFDKLT